MAQKGLLRDANDIEILPITRGELVLDSSGNPALHSNEFLATTSKPGLMSSEDKTKIANLTGGIVDSELSLTSENPVQNKVVTQVVNTNTKLANEAQSTADEAKEEISRAQQLINSIRESYLKSASVSGNTLTIKDQSDTEIEFYNTTYGVVSQTANGLAPSIGTAASATIATQADEWVLTSTKGGTPTWRLLPINAFKNDNSNTTYTFTSGNGGFTVTPSGGSDQFVSIGYIDGQYINKLTGYTKATSASALVTTDTLNTALGKLEYKADLGVTAYDLVNAAYDGDGTIENLQEILKVLDGIKDTETIQAIVGKYLPLSGGTLSGGLTIASGNLISIGGDSVTKKLYPSADNTYLLGQDGRRWSDVKTVLINGGTPIHSGNIGSQSVNYATSAGNADTLDGYHASNFERISLSSALYTSGGNWIRVGRTIKRSGYGTTTNFGTFYIYDYTFGDPAIVSLQVIANIGKVDLIQTAYTGYVARFTKARVVYVEQWNSTEYAYLEIYDSHTREMSFRSRFVGEGWEPIAPTAGSIPSGYTTYEIPLRANKLVAGGFYKKDSSDSYVLLGGGGHKSLSDSWGINITGNAASATKLATARTIWGQSFDGTGNVSGALSGVTSINSAITINSYGNVTIGGQDKAAGNYKLYVSGNMGLGGSGHDTFVTRFLSTTSYALNLQLGLDADGNKLPLYIQWRNSSDIGLYMDGAANVGIGTTSPAYKLDVNGQAAAAGFIKSGSSDSYVLLGAGGHKAISDFMLKTDELTNNLTTITKTLTVTKDWMDTGIKYTDLTTGTYAVQVYVHISGDGIWYGYWSGIMTWCDITTNGSRTDEILLHSAGHAVGPHIYLRTAESLNSAGTNLRLQIAASKVLSSATYTFKFKKLI